MLLQRISLSNFLSHRGISNASGKLTPVDIDLRSSPLWLIYGPNGSGKSSIFDAITFALFKEHRGSGSENRKASYLISDGAGKASVELEIVLDDRSYLIRRELKRSKTSASVSGIVFEWDGRDWVAVRGTKNNVENWVKKNLRMGAKTFTSAVLLQQGEADAFLKAKPKDRKERLLEILDLQFYKRLSDIVTNKRTNTRSEMKQSQQQLANTKKISEIEIEAQNELIRGITNKLSEARRQVSIRELELKDAERTLSIQKNIHLFENEKKDAQKLIGRESQIVSNFKRFRELENDIPVIRNILDIHQRIDEETTELARVSKSITDAQSYQAELATKIEIAQKETDAAAKSSGKLHQKLEKLQARKDSLKEQVDQISQIEKLEVSIVQAEASLEPHIAILNRAKDLDNEKKRYEELKIALPLLDDLDRAMESVAKAENEKSNIEGNLSRLLVEIDQISSEKEVEGKHVLDLKKTKEKFDSAYEQLQSKISGLRNRIEEREKIRSQDECPVCGSRLDSHEAHSRIEQQITNWGHELADFNKELRNIKADIRAADANFKSADLGLKELETKLSTIQTEKAILESRIQDLAEQEREANKQVKKSKARAGKWAQEIENLKILQQEFSQLGKNSKQWLQLNVARNEDARLQAVIHTRQSDLDGLPRWTVKQREKIKSLYDESVQEFNSLKHEVQQAENSHRKSERILTDLRQEEQSTKQKIEHHEDTFRQSERRKSEAETSLSKKVEDVPERLKSHRALLDKKELAKLENEKESLSNAEKEDAELRDARNKVAQLEGQLEQLHSQLSDIPKPHQRPMEKVRPEFQQAQDTAQNLQTKLNSANEELGTMKSGKEDYAKNLAAYEAAGTKFRYFEKLSNAFGRSGLQAQIVQEAQKKIKEAANTTLGYLSNGCWQIELSGDDEQLEILAQDLSKPGLPIRPFEYLSGGEKFRVAISLAVAIGQSISGGRTVNTLIIDEGFGSLDEVNRDNLIAELRRLSEEVLNGGRVVVVSHQEDICDEFAHRLKISKSADGFVSVEQYTG